MFARYFVELPLQSADIESALLAEPQSWVPGLAQQANHHGDALLASVGFGEEVRVARVVELEFGEVIRMPGKTVIPFKWKPVGATGLFPSLEADLEIAPLGSAASQLSISARYVPPLGLIGRAIDKAVLFRVAEATLKDFLDKVASTIQGPSHPAKKGFADTA